jgi:serine/threonine-protein kinase RsbW
MADKVKFTIPGKPEYIAMVRLAVGVIADTSGFNVEEIEDIKTAVGQACKNISCHGKEGLLTEYDLECIADENSIEIYVTDTGSMEGAGELSMHCMDCPNEGDIGVFLIKSLMSEVELIENPNHKKTIKMIKRK